MVPVAEMEMDAKLDALDWLETAAMPEAGVVQAQNLLVLVRAAETRESTVLGMLMARRPYAEIRDYILREQV